MLARQLYEFNQYSPDYSLIVVDDGSRLKPAIDYFNPRPDRRLYCINQDIPWNRGQARNIAGQMADTKWIIQLDIDHILPANCADRLLEILPELDDSKWYRFPRFRVGKADFTRRKDAIDSGCEYGKIHPHTDSYLMTREMFLSNPYDEYFSDLNASIEP